MKASDTVYYRLNNHQITRPVLRKPEDVVAWMGGIQAQDYSGAKWSIGLRLPDATESDVELALKNRRIIRTWLMRGTLHFAAMDDLFWMLELLAPRIIAANRRRYLELELDDNTLNKSNDIIIKALQQSGRLSRKELQAELELNGISVKGQRSAYILQRASLEGLICQSVLIKNNPVYSLTGKPEPGSGIKSYEEALAELARRYFLSRGPATMQDFVWWSGLKVSDAKNGINAVKPQLAEYKIDGKTYLMSPESSAAKNKSEPVRLIPGFDEFLLGYKERGASLDPEFNSRWCPGNNGMFYPLIIINGRAAGTWSGRIKKDKILIETEPFTRIDNSYKTALKDVSERYCRFMGLSPA